MSFFVQSVNAPKPKTANIRPISLLLAAIMTVMAVAQLFTFETFGDVFVGMLGVDSAAASIWAAVVVTLEVTALPFLLSMALSPAARVLGMVAGWIVAGGWLVLSLASNMGIGANVTSGLLGTTVPLPGGWWATFFCLGLCILSAWASWGMWPLQQQSKK